MYSNRYAPTRLTNYPNKLIEMRVAKSISGNSFEPEMFGPSFWFTLHNGAAAYPERPTQYIQQGMKMFIMGLPIMIPCTKCKEHAFNYIRGHNLDVVTMSKAKLFEFFNGFHNFVNAKFGKRAVSLEESKQIYGFDSPNGGPMKISYTTK
jgi:hypothetical protein